MALLPGRELLARLLRGERFLADGGIGSELIRFGVAPEDILGANLGLPDEVRAVHHRYLAAGAHILTANTFGLRDGEDWPQALRDGLRHAIAVAKESDAEIGVWLSLVSSLLPREIETMRFLAAHTLYWPDAILIETCTTLAGAVEAAEAARALKPGLLAVTCHFLADGRMPDGSTAERVTTALIEAGADVVGGNCGETPEAFVEVARRMRSVTEAPLLFQPSAGLPVQTEDGHWNYPVGPEAFAVVGAELFAGGVSIVGGCCGTTPAHIAALAHSVPSEFDRA